MKHSSNNRSSLFLLEIVIAILFFAIVSAVCLRAFAKSHTLSQQAADTNQVISNMENVAELLKSVEPQNLGDWDKITNTLQTVYPELSTQYRIWDIYFDSDWKTCSANDAVYQITVTDKTTIFTAANSEDSGNTTTDASNTSSASSDRQSDQQSLRTYTLTAKKTSDASEIEQLTLKLHTR